jgi:hypothetical protein
MMRAQRPVCCRLGILAVMAFGSAASPGRARADTIVDSFVLPLGGPTDGYQIGAAITMGSTPIALTSVTYGETTPAGPRPGEVFAIYSRNVDGTVGNALFNNFTLSFDAFNFVTTATANSPFTLQAGASYWLTIYALPGQVVFWDSTLTTGANYDSAFGVTLPTTNATAVATQTGYLYYNVDQSIGYQRFRVNGVPVPESPSLILLAAGLVFVGAATRRTTRS